MSKSRQTKAKNFTPAVQKDIIRRDSGCIFCNSGRWTINNEYGQKIHDIAHIVNKSQGGLGIEENGVETCRVHHQELDNGNKGWRSEMQQYIEEYMQQQYPGWNREQLIYKK